MKIILDDSLEPLEPHEWQARRNVEKTMYALEANAAKATNTSRSKMIGVRSPKTASLLSPRGFLNTLSTAYDRHYSIVLHPHDLWYIVLTQMAEEIKDNAYEYRELFTSTEEKQMITVAQDHPTDINVAELIAQLKMRVPGGPETVELFLPELTTITPEARLAHAAAFVSTVSQYYDYGMFCCGIPSIDLRGSKYDWKLLAGNCEELIGFFSGIKRAKVLTKYLGKVKKIFELILQTYTHDPELSKDFWKDIYRQKNVGSGGDLSVNGWIKEFYIKGDNSLLKSFHDTMSAFTYVNLSTKEKFVMVHGAFGANFVADHTLEAAYDHVTYQLLDEERPELNEVQDVVEKAGNIAVHSKKLKDGWTFVQTDSGYGVKFDE
jgi:hypothetical protein